MQIDREILRLAIPAIVSNITTPLLGLVDTAITGHMGAAAYLAAIAVGGSMFSLTYWVMNFLRMGTSGFTSQAFGAGHLHQTHSILHMAMQIAISIGLALIVLSPWICSALLSFMDADADTTQFAATYFKILIYGAPAVLSTFALTGWFLGMQDSRTPMWMALLTNITNIVASLVLVYACHFKIAGVAIGTLIAQYAGLAMGLMIAKRKYGISLSQMLPGVSIKGQTGISLRRFFTVNTDIFLRTLCLAAVTLWFTRAGARQGADIVAANAILMQLFILFSYFMDGFAFAGEAMAGKYYGMGQRRMLSLTVRGIFKWGIVVVLFFTMCYWVGEKPILAVLTDRPEIAALAMKYMPWAIAVPAAGVMAFVWDGIFIGLTMTRRMLISMAIATATFFGVYFTLFTHLGNHGLWLAFISYLILRGLVQTFLYHNPVKAAVSCNRRLHAGHTR